jgi:hypothetical protein
MSFSTEALKIVEEELATSRMALVRIMAKAEVALPNLGYHEPALREIAEIARKALPGLESTDGESV